MRKAKALPIDIYESKSIGNCSNHGISERYNEILLLCEDGFVTVDLDDPPENLCKVVERFLFGETYKHVEPVAKPSGAGWMAGGCYVGSSDSRFNRISRYPLSLHDRCESWEMYERLSR